jgi:hypothetical protein
MSRIVGDALVSGGIVDEPDIVTAEVVQCWPRPETAELPMEYVRAKVRGKFCDKRGERVAAGTCKAQHA